MNVRQLSLGVVACALTAALPGITHADLVEWPVADGGNGNLYEVVLVPDGVTWTDANIDADTRNGHLVTILSDAENDFVFNLVDDMQYWSLDTNREETLFWLHGPWIGAYQDNDAELPVEGWQWVDSQGDLAYDNWMTGEPNNSYYPNLDQYEDVAHFLAFDETPGIQPAATWNDRNDNVKPVSVISYVVEYEVPAAPTLAAIGMGIACVARRRR